MVLLAAVVAVLAAAAASLASSASIPVTLRVAGDSFLDVGQSVRLTATARLPRGDRLLIQRLRPGRSTVKVAECLRSPCRGSYRGTTVGAVGFQASVIKRAGGKVTTLGRSRRLAASWVKPAPPPPLPPPPAPPPAALSGHYVGKAADNELFAFDVGADGLSLSNLQTGQMNQSCDPPAYLSGGNIHAGGPYPVTQAGAFTISGSFAGSVDGAPSTNNVTFTGNITGGTATGTYREDTSFTLSNGTGYNCTTGTQTWSASKV